MANPGNNRPPWVWPAVILGLVIYAYGFWVTEVNLDQIRDETRRVGLVRILRALARPEILEQDLDVTNTDVPIRIPCTEGEKDEGGEGGGRIVLNPPCADPRATIEVSGNGFEPTTEVRVFLVPESQVELRLAEVRTDGAGEFTTEVRLPNRPSESAQTIRVVSTEPVGSPRWTQTARDTLDKIIETVFLALIATTFATLLAVPLSFLAARNLMEDIQSTVTNVAMSLIALPLGVAGGILAANLAGRVARVIGDEPWLGLAGLLLTLLAGAFILRRAIPAEETERPSPAQRTQRAVLLVLVFLLVMLGLYLAASLLEQLGAWLEPRLGAFRFLGAFLGTAGELVSFGLVVASAIFGGGVLVMVFNRFGHGLRKRLSSGALHALAIPLAMVAGALWAILLARAIAWFYEWSDLSRTFWIPLVVGALAGLWVAFRVRGRPSVRLGLGIYYITRTVFNVLRAIEPLIMAIVFVVWVGIGPFAGALALALHTIAALAKLYSEQVESISAGPLEAVRATGANRLQNVVYAVVPQIIPPYISFTMYRWDINVRMSTIIGFVGGGGIGFLLQQNINLLDYRAAAAQILAIAIVVAAMDWLSSRIRARYV
ncbi:MAG TPA: ABC transporter permease subunit [Acidimicrobiia bacterium]|nr:ABC transporter permease subunit [Acidimicrobiia bacterium]